jgi:Ca2+-binding EF-hand superfamily protein
MIMEKLLELKEKYRMQKVQALEHVFVTECIEQVRIFSRQELAQAYLEQGVEVTEAEIEHWFDTYGFALQYMIGRTGLDYTLDATSGKVEAFNA